MYSTDEFEIDFGTSDNVGPSAYSNQNRHSIGGMHKLIYRDV